MKKMITMKNTFAGRVGIVLLGAALAFGAFLFIQSFQRPFWLAMGWNLFLAIIPVGLAALAYYWKSSLRWALWLASVAFVPNAWYVITDIRHLVWLHPKPPELSVIRTYQWDTLAGGNIWVSEMAVFILAALGAVCGIVAMYLLVRAVLEPFSKKVWSFGGALLAAVLAFASGFAIYLGRYPRLNSWQLVTEPSEVFSHIMASVTSDSKAVMVTVIYGIVITLCIWAVMWVMDARKR